MKTEVMCSKNIQSIIIKEWHNREAEGSASALSDSKMFPPVRKRKVAEDNGNASEFKVGDEGGGARKCLSVPVLTLHFRWDGLIF